MEKIKVITSQNVAIEYTLANVGERLIANIMDYLLFAAYFIVFAIINNVGEIHGGRAFWVVVSLGPMLYQLVCEITMNGQSFGMRYRKIKVVRLDGKELTVGNCLLRWILRPVDILISGGGIAVVAIVMTDKGQRLGDIAAGTTVVKMKTDVGLNNTILDLTEENYVPVFREVSRLNDRDISIIKESILLSEKTSVWTTAYAAQRKIEGLLQIKSNPPSDPVTFLKTVVKDYNHITGNRR